MAPWQGIVAEEIAGLGESPPESHTTWDLSSKREPNVGSPEVLEHVCRAESYLEVAGGPTYALRCTFAGVGTAPG